MTDTVDMDTSIATVLVNWNNCQDTIRCIESLKQSRTGCHIIVVDNGSQGDDVAKLSGIGGITLIAHPANAGFGQGCNIGLRWALDHLACEYLFILNNDTTVSPDVLELLETALKSDRSIGVATPRILVTDTRAVWYGGGEISWLTGGARITGIWGPENDPSVMTERDVSFASGCALFTRREILERVGLFDPRLFMYEEDIDLCLRIAENGWKIRYVPSAVVLHDEQGSQRQREAKRYSIQDPRNPRLPFYMYHRTRNKLLVFRQYAHGVHAVQFGIGFPVYWFAKCIQFALHGRWDAVRAVVLAVRDYLRSAKCDNAGMISTRAETVPTPGRSWIQSASNAYGPAIQGRNERSKTAMPAQLDAAYLRCRPKKAITRLISYSLFEGRPLTTRGKWFNPVVFFLSALGKHLPALKKVHRPIFIIGTGRSGTTLLGTILSMHRDVGFLNEPKALWHAIYPHEDVVGNYSRGEALYRLDAQHASPQVTRNAHRLIGHYLTTVGARRLVDKYPEHVYRVPFLLSIFPDAKFIFLTRNGWETCASIVDWSRRHRNIRGGEVHDWWGVNRRKWHFLVDQLVDGNPLFAGRVAIIRSYTLQYEMAAVEWIVAMREGLRVWSLYPRSVMMLKFEDLTAQTEKTLDDLLRFCELDDDPVFRHYARERIVPPRTSERFVMHPELRDLFRDTSQMLGYPP